MRIQGFRSNCDFQASWGYAPALPTRTQLVFLRTSFQKNEPQATKSFSVQQFFKNAAEVWASSPRLRSKFDYEVWYSCCNCIFWNFPIQTKLNDKNQDYRFEQGNGAIAARWQAKAGVEPPFAGRERPFSLRRIYFLEIRPIRNWFP